MSRVVSFEISQCDCSCPYNIEHNYEQQCQLADRLFEIGEQRPFPAWCPLPESGEKEESK